jgi:hypothetical protein
MHLDLTEPHLHTLSLSKASTPSRGVAKQGWYLLLILAPAPPQAHQHGPKLCAAGELQTAPEAQSLLQVLLTGLGDSCKGTQSRPCPKLAVE